MPGQHRSPPATVRSHIARMAAVFLLYALGIGAALGAYIAGVALAASVAAGAWGANGAIATVAGILALTALLSIFVARAISHHLERGASTEHESEDESSGEISRTEAAPHEPPQPEPSWGKLLESLIGSRLAAESWVTAASILAATVAIAGPMRVVRIALRLFVVARTLRTILATTAARSERQ